MTVTVESLQAELDEMINAHPCTDVSEVARLMTQQLDVALHGSTWARDASPRAVWHGLLDEVRRGRGSA